MDVSQGRAETIERLEAGVLDGLFSCYGPRQAKRDWFYDPHGQPNDAPHEMIAVRYGCVHVRLSSAYSAPDDRIDVLWVDDADLPRSFPEFWFDLYEGTTIENVIRFWDQKLDLRDLAAGGNLAGTQVMVWKDGHVSGNTVLFRSSKAKSMLGALREAGLERVRMMAFDDPAPDLRDRMTLLGALV